MLADMLLAVVGWVAVGWLPGAVLLTALRPRAGMLRNAAFAPLVSVGLVMLAAETWYVAGVTLRWWNVLALALGVPLAAAVVRQLARRDALSTGEPQTSTQDRALLLSAALAGLVIWLAGLPHLSSVLTNNDGAHHALYTQRIASLGTLAPTKVLTGDLPTGDPAAHYYPLAMHVSAAMVSKLSGASVSLTITVGFVLATVVVLPLGLFVLLRRLFPDEPVVAGVAAIISAVFPWLPYSVLEWGGIPVIVGTSLVPAGVDALWRRKQDGGPVPLGIVLGLAGYGVFQVHNPELVAIALIAVIIAVVQRPPADERRVLVQTWLAGVVVLAVVVAPLLPALHAGAREATSYLGAGKIASTATKSVSGFDWLFLAGNPLVLPFAIAGIVIAVRRRAALGWVAGAAAATALWLLCEYQLPGLKYLTIPWYSNSVRASYLFPMFECSFAAVGVVCLARRWGARVARRFDVRPVLAAATPYVLIGAVSVLIVVDVSIALVRQAYRDASLVGPDQRAAFAWLAGHVQPGQRVLNQSDDGSGWMETLDGVHPVFATKADTAPTDPETIWGDRWYLLTHAYSLSTDPRAQAAVRHWDVGYVYVSSKIFPAQASRLSADRLAHTAGYQVVWRRGDVTIFQVLTS